MKIFELLNEAKETGDFRHKDIFAELPYWPEKDNPKYIKPEDGFHFTFDQGLLILSSTDNITYSQVASDPRRKEIKGKLTYKDIRALTHGKTSRDLWNQLGGVVELNSQLITISKEDVDGKSRTRTISDVKSFQLALKNLKKYGVTDDFKIKGTSAPINGKTVGEVLKISHSVDAVFGAKIIPFYHGTSASRAEIIKTKGLIPGKTEGVYVDLIKGYSEHNVYLATDPKTAEFYGKRQAVKDGDATYVVFKIELPDKAKIVADDNFAQWDGKITGHNNSNIKAGLKNNSSVGYKGRIAPKFLSVLSTKKA